MRRSRLLPLLVLPALLVSGCAEARETVANVQACAGLAADVARSGLQGVPTQAEAEQAVQRLDDRVQDLEEGSVKDAATALRDRLRDLQQAAGDADPAAAREAAEAARDAARETAEACSLPVDQFLG